MKFSEFAKPFHGTNKAASALHGVWSQPKIIEFILQNAVKKDDQNNYAFSDETYKRYFTGTRIPTVSFWDEFIQNFDEERFTKVLQDKLNDSAIDRLFSAFKIEVKDTERKDKNALAFSIAKQLKAIAEGRGEANLIANEVYREYMKPVDFSEYVNKSYEKYSKRKTILYSSEARPIEEFYVCNNIRTTFNGLWTRESDEEHKDSVIKNATLESIFERNPYCLLIGPEGIGKSMMMYYLFIDSIKKCSKIQKFPILVNLREFSVEKNDIFDLITSSVKRFDTSFSTIYLHKFLNEGRCQLLLDGLDEIKAKDIDSFGEQIDFLLDNYPQNNILISTRSFSDFISYTRFKPLWIENFTNNQSLELIDKLKFCPEEPRVKEQFKEKMKEEYFSTHPSFVSNPLLLTLMLMCYGRFANIPERRASFYEEAYQTLLRRHDHDDKLSYKRAFRSVVEPSEFTLVFREFCARSYRNADYEFDIKLFEKYFDLLTTKNQVSNKEIMTMENFLFDVCNSVCIMYDEGQNYHFLHRSFQEYLFADYYANKADDASLKRLERWLRNHNETCFDESIAYKLLYDMASEKVEKSIFIPMLEYIFCEDTDEDNYWSFLKKVYSNYMYAVMDKKLVKTYLDKENVIYLEELYESVNEVDSVVMKLMYSILHLKTCYKLNYEDQSKLEIPELEIYYFVADNLKMEDSDQNDYAMMDIEKCMIASGGISSIKHLSDGLVCDEKGIPVVFGKEYTIDFEDIINEPSKYSVFIELFTKESCPLRHCYEVVKRYYEGLVNKYSEEKLDDDF